ncbi:TPA: hypothetical protein MRP31_004859, partial [Escherichia coli]|nr:hypothetical protein [Escherichia coli]
RDGVNMLGNMASSVKDIIAGGNTNMRRTPGVREEKLKNIKEGANKQVISSQADSLIKISRIWADFFPANTSNQPI